MADAADRQHLRAVLGGGDVADRLALRAHRRRLGAEVAVGVDLQLDAAVAEDALGDHGHHVDALVLAGDDEGCRLVVGIGGAGADAGDELLGLAQQPALPVLVAQERHHRAVAGLDPLGHHQRIDPGEHALDVGIAVAGADLARLMRQRTGQASQATMPGAACSGTAARIEPPPPSPASLRRQDRRADPVRRRRHLADGDAGRVADGIEDGRRRRDQRRLAHPLGAERAPAAPGPRSG